MIHATFLIVLLPLLRFALLLLAGTRPGDPVAGWLATAAMAGAFGASVITWAGLLGRSGDARSYTQVIYHWIPVGGLQLNVAFLADPLSITMALFITGIGALIHLYS